MILRLFKAFWFLSVVALLANLLWVYAGLPEDVIIQDDGQTSRIVANREFLFYVTTLTIVLINVLIFPIKKFFEKNVPFRIWFHGMMITINVFLIMAMQLVQLYNSGENFRYAEIGFIVYGSLGLMILWALSWPVYSIFAKKLPNQPVL